MSTKLEAKGILKKIINSVDFGGNSLLHLAEIFKRNSIKGILEEKSEEWEINKNCKNKKGQTYK